MTYQICKEYKNKISNIRSVKTITTVKLAYSILSWDLGSIVIYESTIVITKVSIFSECIVASYMNKDLWKLRVLSWWYKRAFFFISIAFSTYFLSCYDLLQFVPMIQNSSILFIIGHLNIFGLHRSTWRLAKRAKGCRDYIARL